MFGDDVVDVFGGCSHKEIIVDFGMGIDIDFSGVLSAARTKEVGVDNREKDELVRKIRLKLEVVDSEGERLNEKIKFLEEMNIKVIEAFDFLLDFDKKLDDKTGMYVQNTRRSGEIYAYHPLEVLRILVNEFNFDNKDERFTDLFVATILHDAYEDELEGKGKQFWMKKDKKLLHVIKSKFKSDGILLRLDGVSKFKKDGIVYDQKTYDNVMQAALVYPDILKLKLADRLHNWRTIDSMSLRKKLDSARETKEFFLPIAERLGMSAVVDEFNKHIGNVLLEAENYNLEHVDKLVPNFENLYDISPWWSQIGKMEVSLKEMTLNELYGL